MNKYFPERYSRVMPNATRELIDARWRGIERLARFIKREDIAPIMVFVRSGKFSSALDEQVRNVFKEEDVNFPMRDRNDGAWPSQAASAPAAGRRSAPKAPSAAWFSRSASSGSR